MRSWLLLGILVTVAALWLIPGGGAELQRLNTQAIVDLARILPPPLASWVWVVPPWFLLVLLLSGSAALILALNRQPSSRP